MLVDLKITRFLKVDLGWKNLIDTYWGILTERPCYKLCGERSSNQFIWEKIACPIRTVFFTAILQFPINFSIQRAFGKHCCFGHSGMDVSKLTEDISESWWENKQLLLIRQMKWQQTTNDGLKLWQQQGQS